MNSKKIIKDITQDFYLIMELHYLVTHEMVGTLASKKKYWMGKEQIFSAKIVNHLFTLLYLCKGTPVKMASSEYITVDHSSISVVLRALIETYLAFNYIFISPQKNINETKLRYLSWIYCDLISKMFLSNEKLELKEKESKKILELLEKISLFKSLTNNQKKSILRGDWKIKKSWSDLALSAGFKKESFDKIYKYLCSHSHTGSHSIAQVKMKFEIEKEIERTIPPLTIGLIILSYFIKDYCNLHHKAKQVFKKNDGPNLISKYLTDYKNIIF